MATIPEEIWEKLSRLTKGRLNRITMIGNSTHDSAFYARCMGNNEKAFQNIGAATGECAAAFKNLGEAWNKSKLIIRDWHVEKELDTRCSTHGIEFCFTCKCKAIRSNGTWILGSGKWDRIDNSMPGRYKVGIVGRQCQ